MVGATWYQKQTTTAFVSSDSFKFIFQLFARDALGGVKSRKLRELLRAQRAAEINEGAHDSHGKENHATYTYPPFLHETIQSPDGSFVATNSTLQHGSPAEHRDT